MSSFDHRYELSWTETRFTPGYSEGRFESSGGMKSLPERCRISTNIPQPNRRAVWASVIFTFLMTEMFGLSLMPLASIGFRSDIEKAQQTLRDEGYSGPVPRCERAAPSRPKVEQGRCEQ